VVPPGGSCVKFDFQFLSEEFPEYVGSQFNDAFVAELDVTTWTMAPNLVAPDNFAVDGAGLILTINSATMSAMNAQPNSIFDGGTVVFTAFKATTPGPHTLYLSIFDASDSGYDTAVFIDNLDVCAPPVPPPEPSFLFDNTRRTCLDRRVLFTDTSQRGVLPPPANVLGGEIVSWAWDFGDGNTANVQHPQHVYAAEGNYTVSLTVTDANGLNATFTDTVYSIGPVNCCPELQPLRAYFAFEGRAVRIRLIGIDYENHPLTYTMQPMPPGSSLVGNQFQWFTRAGDAGTYEGSVTVRDDPGNNQACSATQPFRITIRPYSPGDPVLDTDGDGVPDASDNCPDVPNHDQRDADRDGIGNACQDALASHPDDPTWSMPQPVDLHDTDGDGIPDVVDNCPQVPNRLQSDLDGDGFGDMCDDDMDGDGIANDLDACPASHGSCDAPGALACSPDAGCKPLGLATSESAKSNLWSGLALMGAALLLVAASLLALVLRGRNE
jgi:PKD repeat protein